MRIKAKGTVTLGGNMAWMLVEHVGKILLTLILTMLLTRALGVEGYGALQYSLSLIAVFSAIGFICSSEIVVPRLVIAETQSASFQIVGAAYYLRMMASIISYIILFIYVAVFESRVSAALILLLGVVIIANEPFAVTTAWLQSQTRIASKSKIVILSYTVKIIYVYVLYALGVRDLYLYAAAWVLESVIISAGLHYIFVRTFEKKFYRLNLPLLADLLKSSLPFFLGLVCMYSFSKMDLIFLKKMHGNSSAGIYAAAQQLLFGVTAVAPIISISLAPSLVYGKSRGSEVRRNILKIAMFMALVAILGAIGIFLLAEKIVLLVFGVGFEATVAILRWMSFVSIFVYLDSAFNIHLIRYKKGSFLVYKWLAGLIVSFCFYIILIPGYGGMGAIYGLLAGYVVVCCLGFYKLMAGEVD